MDGPESFRLDLLHVAVHLVVCPVQEAAVHTLDGYAAVVWKCGTKIDH